MTLDADVILTLGIHPLNHFVQKGSRAEQLGCPNMKPERRSVEKKGRRLLFTSTCLPGTLVWCVFKGILSLRLPLPQVRSQGNVWEAS